MEIEMTSRPRRWLLIAQLGAGLLALVVLWLPYDAVAMSFSGPSRITNHVGLLSCVEASTHYRPLRLATWDPFRSRPIEPPSLKPGEVIWDHRGEFGTDLVILTVQEKTVTVNYLALAGSVLGTVVVLWLALVRPGKRLIQSFHVPRECALSNPGGFSSAV